MRDKSLYASVLLQLIEDELDSVTSNTSYRFPMEWSFIIGNTVKGDKLKSMFLSFEDEEQSN